MMKKEKDITDKLCRPIPKGDVSLDLMLSQEDEEKLKNGGFISLFGKDLVIDGFRQQEAVTDQLEKEYQISSENYDKDLYETKVD